MTHLQTSDHPVKLSALRDYWEALKQVASLKSQAYRWVPVIEPEIDQQIRVLLTDVESSLSPILGIVDRLIRGESPLDVPSIGPLTPILGKIGRCSDLLSGQAKPWLQELIESGEKSLVPRGESASQFLADVVDWHKDVWAEQVRQKPDQAGNEHNTERLDYAMSEVLRTLERFTGRYFRRPFWQMLEVDFPDSSPSEDEAEKIQDEVFSLRSGQILLRNDSAQTHEYFMEKLESITSISRTVRKFQDALIRKAQQELMSMEKPLS